MRRLALGKVTLLSQIADGKCRAVCVPTVKSQRQRLTKTLGKESKMSTPAQSALKSVSDRARFLLDEYDSHPLAKFEAELIKIDEQLAIIAAKLSGDGVASGRGRTSLGRMLMKIKTWGS